MATIRKHKSKGGAVSFTATVRIAPLPPACNTLPVRKDVEAWAKELERELRKQRDRGGIRRDVPKMTVAQLIREYLDDPETKSLRYYDSLSRLLAWWTGHHGATKVMELNVLQLREARTTLKSKRAAGVLNAAHGSCRRGIAAACDAKGEQTCLRSCTVLGVFAIFA